LAIVVKQKASRPVGERPSAVPVAKQRGSFIRRFVKPIKPVEVIFFTSQLSLMLEIGTSLTNALGAMVEQTHNRVFKQVIRTMLVDIEEGRQLSDAMNRHPQIFNRIFTSMVHAGETGGFLKMILDRMVEMQEKRQALITQVRTTLTYPVMLCVVALGVVIFVLVGILPKFEVIFEGKERILPLTTQFLMAMSSFLQQYWWVCILFIAAILVGLKFWKDSEHGQALIDRFFVSTPIIAGLSNKIYTCNLLRTLGHLMESQVPLLEALKVTRDTFRNRHFRQFIEKIMDHVEEGGRFSRPFADYPYVMESVKQMVATGEEIGNLPRVMLRLAEFYDNEVDRGFKIVASMIEPLALIFLGIVVGIIVSSVILPIFRIASAIH